MIDVLMTNTLKAWRFLYRRGFIEGFGHISARLPNSDHFMITRHSLAMNATADDFLVFDLDGRKLHGAGEPPGEYPIHLDILRERPDVGSVIHYHGMHSTASPRVARPCGLSISWERFFTMAFRFILIPSSLVIANAVEHWRRPWGRIAQC